MMKRFIVIVAGGKGLRMGTDLPKQFIPIAGKPVLMHTIEVFHKWDSEAEIIVVLPKEHQAYWKMLCEEIKGGADHTVADGGETRFHSVRNGLLVIKNILSNREERHDKIIVGIHDGVRPFVSSAVIERCFEKADECGAAIPVIPVVDSLRIKDSGETKAVNRSDYVAVQTPQVFEWELLLSSYDQPYSDRFTDDASVVESTGRKIATVSGNPENIKLTTPIDLLVAEKTIEMNQ
jgi:2-C-methyl-D-erythritol 4-phosphate cytidylyltransferase